MNQELTIMDIAEIAASSRSAIIFLQGRNLLRVNVACVCGSLMVLAVLASKINLGHCLRCPNPNCKRKQSLNIGTFFANLHFPIFKYIYLFYYWASQTPISVTVEHLSISIQSLINHYNYCRDICSWQLLQQPIRLGGLNVVVQIDESLFVKAKYHLGHALYRPQRWVFGIYDTNSRQGYLTFVASRDEQTLLPIIQQIVLPGSIIHSDEWRAYNGIRRLPHPQPYRHHTVNHSAHFVDPITGVHTNHVEAMWSRAKRKFKSMNGTYDQLIPSYLDEFMWRERYGETNATAFDNLLTHIHARYP